MVALLLSGPAGAATDGAADKTPYQGAFWALQGEASMTLRRAAGEGESPGLSGGLSLRLATVLSLADIQVSLLGGSQALAWGTGGHTLDRGSLEVEARLHPLFLWTLRNTRLGFGVSGFYVSTGLGMEVTSWRDAGTEVDVSWHVGTGLDVPLTDPQEGASLWLGMGYRMKFLAVDGPQGHPLDLDAHTIVITLGYRDNDIGFMRWPRPTEFFDPVHGDGE